MWLFTPCALGLSRSHQILSMLLPSAEEQRLTQGQSQYIRAKVNTSHHVKKAEEARVRLQKIHRLRAKREAAMAEVRREMEELDAAWRRCERAMQEAGAPRGQDIQLAEEQVREAPPPASNQSQDGCWVNKNHQAWLIVTPVQNTVCL